MKEVRLIYFNHHLYNSQTMRSHEHARTLETKAFRSLCMFIHEAIINNILEIIKSLCVGPVSEFLIMLT